MAKLTVLEIVQDVLNSMDSDEVNSIDDTIEAQQVAQIAKTVYNELMANKDWPHLRTMCTLTGLASVTRPVYMSLASNIKRIDTFKYNVRKATDTRDKYETIKYITPEKFLYKANQLDSSAATVTQITDTSGVKFLVRNNAAPTYYTSFDDENIITDSYDSAVDTTLQTTKTQCFGYKLPVFTITNSHVPDLPDEMFPLFLAEVKSTAFVELRQVENPKAEQQSQRQRRVMSQNSWKVNGDIRYGNFGRRSKK